MKNIEFLYSIYLKIGAVDYKSLFENLVRLFRINYSAIIVVVSNSKVPNKPFPQYQ
jgi:hypothetical protein